MSVGSGLLLGVPAVHPKGKRVVAGWGGGIRSGLVGRDTAPRGLWGQGRVQPAPTTGIRDI